MTPEGRVKAKVNRRLQGLRPQLYKFMPVQNGMGAPALDYFGCFIGNFFAIETKKPGGKPTPRQLQTIKEIENAGGLVFVVDGDDDIDYMMDCLQNPSHYSFSRATHAD